MRGFKMVLFTASRGNNFVGGTCAPPSALLVFHFNALGQRASSLNMAKGPSPQVDLRLTLLGSSGICIGGGVVGGHNFSWEHGTV